MKKSEYEQNIRTKEDEIQSLKNEIERLQYELRKKKGMLTYEEVRLAQNVSDQEFFSRYGKGALFQSDQLKT